MKRSPLILISSILVIIGLVFIAIASLSEANSTTGDQFFFVKKQSIWLILGIITFFIFSKVKISLVKKISFPIYLLSIFTLILVLIPKFGNSALGARRWLDLGILGIQPSELLKFSSIIYFSYLFSLIKKVNIKSLIIYLGLPFVLIVAEPNLSTAILVSAIVITIYYLAAGDILPLFTLCSIAAVLCLILIFTSDYRLTRFKTFLDPKRDSSSSSYHRNQIILTLASGGLFGKGFANSDQKYKFLPKISTDSILAVIGEETGFIGLSVILYLYLYLIFYLFKLSQQLSDKFESLFVSSIACWIAYQSLFNISALVGLIPLTGVPLPFISYGGSSLLTLLASLGIVKNIENKSLSLIYSSSHKSNEKQNNQNHRSNRIPSHTGNRTDSSANKRSSL